MKMRLTRHVTPTECHWLKRTYWAGETVYKYSGHTYGCISRGTGVACTEQFGQIPFFELPGNALEEIE